ncbi:hypothetical protein ACHAWF_000811 [Thalassiosira exigua]
MKRRRGGVSSVGAASRSRPNSSRIALLSTLAALLLLLLASWILAAFRLLVLSDVDEAGIGVVGRGSAGALRRNRGSTRARDAEDEAPHVLLPELLSRNQNVTATSSARGNLGPPSVLTQDPPGEDWLRDRWQAASDMGGTAIPGTHWIVLDFSRMLMSAEGGGESVAGAGSGVRVSKVVLDWEAAYSKDYRIEGRRSPPPSSGGEDGGWCILYDTAREQGHLSRGRRIRRSEREYGQSPGVKRKMPLHVVHTIDWQADRAGESEKNCPALMYLRVCIRKPAMGWGVSLWQADVYGAIVSEGGAIQ